MKPSKNSKNTTYPESYCCSGFFLLLVIAIALPPLLYLQSLNPQAKEGADKAIQERAGQRIMTAARWEQQRQALLKEKRNSLLTEMKTLEASREGKIQEAMGFALLQSSLKAREDQNRLLDGIGSSARSIQLFKQNEQQRRQEQIGRAVLVAYQRDARDSPDFRRAFQKELTRLSLVDGRKLNRMENNLKNLLVHAGKWSVQKSLILNEAAETARRSETIFLESDRSGIQKAISGLDRDLSVYITPEDYRSLAGFVPEIFAGRKGVSDFVNYGFFALLGLSVVWLWLVSLANKESPPLDFSETRAVAQLEEQEARNTPTRRAA